MRNNSLTLASAFVHKSTLFCGFLMLFFTSISNLVWSQSPAPVQDFNVHPRAYTSRNSFWTEFNIGGAISKKGRFQYQLDFQYRRAADASYIVGGNQANIFKEIQQNVYRPWIHYWIIPGALRVSLSPLGYWATWTPGEETSLYPNRDSVTTGQSVYPEFRICPQVTTIQNFGRVQFVNRFRYEFRFLGERRAADNGISDYGKGYNMSPTDVGNQSTSLGWFGSNHAARFRWQTRIQIPFNHPKMQDKTFYINTWDELFIQMGSNLKNEKLLNQNRFVCLLGYRFNKECPIKVEAGLTLQTNFLYNMNTPPTNSGVTYQKSNIENNHAFTIYVIFDDFHKLFRKKEKSS